MRKKNHRLLLLSSTLPTPQTTAANSSRLSAKIPSSSLFPLPPPLSSLPSLSLPGEDRRAAEPGAPLLLPLLPFLVSFPFSPPLPATDGTTNGKLTNRKSDQNRTPVFPFFPLFPLLPPLAFLSFYHVVDKPLPGKLVADHPPLPPSFLLFSDFFFPFWWLTEYQKARGTTEKALASLPPSLFLFSSPFLLDAFFFSRLARCCRCDRSGKGSRLRASFFFFFFHSLSSIFPPPSPSSLGLSLVKQLRGVGNLLTKKY